MAHYQHQPNSVIMDLATIKDLADPNSTKLFQRRPPPQVFIGERQRDDDEDMQSGSTHHDELGLAAARPEEPVSTALNQLSEIRNSMAEMRRAIVPVDDFSKAIENIKQVGQVREQLIMNMEAVRKLRIKIENQQQKSLDEEREKGEFMGKVIAKMAEIQSQTRSSSDEENHLNKKLPTNVLKHVIQTGPGWGTDRDREQSLAKLEYTECKLKSKGQDIVTVISKNKCAFTLVPIARQVLPPSTNAATGNNSEVESSSSVLRSIKKFNQ